MKQGLKYGLALSLTLPLGCAFAAEQLKDDRASTLRSLETITSKVDEAPALLLLSPTQMDALRKPVEKEVTKPTRRPASKKPVAPDSASMTELKTLQAKINQLNDTLSQRDQELKQLRQAAQQDANARAEISQLKQNLEDNLQATEQMQQDLAAAAAVKSENSQNNGRLQQALEHSQQQSSVLQKQLDALAKSHNDNNQENKALQAALNESRKQAEQAQQALAALTAKAQATPALQTALDESHKQNESLQSQLAALRKEVVEPKSKSEIRDYAIGNSLAEDMLALLKERAAQGIEVDSRLALAGVQDTFAGKLKLQPEQIDSALGATEVALRQNEQQQTENTKAAGKRYFEQFAKQKQVKKEALGYLYRIDKPGKGPISADNMISVVVKESLINGKVIKDMAAADTSITQLLSSYPPIFRSALLKLQNHGSITMVVPPALAYGDKGLPPDIPPGSTMIYNVRILDIAQPATPAK